MAFSFSLEECARINADLSKAANSKDEGRLKDILQQLKASNPKGKLTNLRDSKLAAMVAKLGKYPNDGVVSLASALRKEWASLAGAAKKNPAAAPGSSSEVKPEVKPEVKEEEPLLTEVKPEVKPEPAAAPVPEPSAAAASSSSSAAPGLERSASLSVETKYRAAAKTGDPTRDHVRSKMQEAFEKGKQDNLKYLREMACDTAVLAEEAESHMEVYFKGANTKEYKARSRTLMYNLKDPKNPTFIMRVVTGQIHVNDLAEMEVKDMASDEMKKLRAAQLEHAKMSLMDDRTYNNYAGKNTEDGILKCPRCKSMKTQYIEVQTRSADEPTTKKCNCNNCDYRWKFC